MKQIQKPKQKRKNIKSWFFFAASLVSTIILLVIFTDRQSAVIKSSWQIFMEMIVILPAVMVLIGLFAVCMPNEMVIKLLGKTSGIKGVVLSLLFGALPTGPLYIAFPMAATLVKKGARVSNMIIFLSAWACIKIPQEMVELQFLGIKFMALRLGLTIFFVIIMGILIERIIELNAIKKVKS